ncbi:MAG: acyl carrier protein [Chlorobiaceae bacterium]|nr:acyl carrier protein [Chlorobiaceae bacterium]
MVDDEIRNNVSQFISKTFLFDPNKKIDEEISLLGTGVIDSTGVLELISYLESKYQIKFEDEELIGENFDSIEKITGFISKKLLNI